MHKILQLAPKKENLANSCLESAAINKDAGNTRRTTKRMANLNPFEICPESRELDEASERSAVVSGKTKIVVNAIEMVTDALYIAKEIGSRYPPTTTRSAFDDAISRIPAIPSGDANLRMLP